MTDELDLGMRAALAAAEIEVGRAGFLRHVHEVGRAEIPHLKLVAVIADPRPVAVKAVRRDLKVEVFRQHTRVSIDAGGRVVTGNVEPAMVHHVIQVHADAETMRRLDQTQQVGLRSVKSADRSALILAAEIERVEQIVAHRETAARLGGRRNPDRVVPGFRQFGHFRRDLVPGRVEILEHRFTAQ